MLSPYLISQGTRSRKAHRMYLNNIAELRGFELLTHSLQGSHCTFSPSITFLVWRQYLFPQMLLNHTIRHKDRRPATSVARGNSFLRVVRPMLCSLTLWNMVEPIRLRESSGRLDWELSKYHCDDKANGIPWHSRATNRSCAG